MKALRRKRNMAIAIEESISLDGNSNRPTVWLESAFVRQGDRLALWVPVCMAAGIGFYYSLQYEPAFWAALLPLFVTILALYFVWSKPAVRIVMLALCLACAGFCLAQLRTHLVHTPILKKDLGPVEVTATVAAIESLDDEGNSGARLLLKDLLIEDLPPERTPRKVRLRVRDQSLYAVGQRVKLLAELLPPSPPVMPGAFDFQRHLYFQGIGAVGFVYKFLSAEPQTQSGFMHWAEDMRRAVDLAVADNMPAHQSGIAAALLTGRQTTISQSDKLAMQNSGLAHLLAVSGLNVGLFSSAIFFVLRFLMALFPAFALRYPIKKIAAAAAFVAACFYLVLAGFVIPAQRAVIMIGIVLVAVVLDRSPLSLRLLAAAAGIVLAAAPESLISASFQMSFAAVGGLILFFEHFRERLSALYSRAGIIRRAGLYLLGVCMTTVIATIATTPLSLYHFQQMTTYGLLANLIAVPLMAFMIMPAAIAALFLMPFGWAYAPLWFMGLGIDWTLATAHAVAALPGAVTFWPLWPPQTLALIFGGLIWLVLWRGRLRWLGFLPVFISAVLVASHVMPDVIIARDFNVVAIRSDAGVLHVSTLRKQKFAIENWERLNGFAANSSVAWPKSGKAEGLDLACDALACRLEMKGKRISIAFDPEALAEEIAWADAIISYAPAGEPIRQAVRNAPGGKILLDKFDGLDDGAHALWLEDDATIRVDSADHARGIRPWSHLNAAFSDKTLKARPAGPGSLPGEAPESGARSSHSQAPARF